MASLAPPSFTSTITVPGILPKSPNFFQPSNAVRELGFPPFYRKCSPVCCAKLSLGETASATFAPSGTAGDYLLKKTSNILETLGSVDADETPETITQNNTDTNYLPALGLQLLKWPMWLLGPSILLITGMIPTLWLPISSIFLGPNIASLLSLIGLDCIFNLGATLFLLMADSCARPEVSKQVCISKAPFSYQFWNMFATVTGFVIPIMMLFGSQRDFLQPLSFISFAVLFGPYLLLLSVQVLTEMLTWHWKSPVWLVTPVVYEAYRLLQLMRGLKLGTELSAPAWTMHTIRGLVSWWVLILGMQLMRVAWFAGFTARRQQHLASADD